MFHLIRLNEKFKGVNQRTTISVGYKAISKENYLAWKISLILQGTFLSSTLDFKK